MSDFDQGGGTYSKLFEAQEKKQSPAPAPIVEPVKQENKPAPEKHRKRSSNRDTTVSRYHDTTSPTAQPSTTDEDGYLEDLRKAVKQLGEKAATHRFTGDEKDQLADLVFAYRRKGITTSENEITRIAVNYMLYDYHKNKQSSIIARVLERLHG